MLIAFLYFLLVLSDFLLDLFDTLVFVDCFLVNFQQHFIIFCRLEE